ncbi:hypothetical protein LCL95_15240 [Bacillus timonensis]|nr:hypothetical protein [Bacillus timonensis]
MGIKKTLVVCFILLIGLLSGCASIDEETKNTKLEVENVFEAKPLAANEKHQDFSYYIPENMDIESKGDYNLIFKDGKQLYILFINPIENKASDTLYKSTVHKTGKVIVDETFKDKERFGYVKVFEIDKNIYEVSVGLGGIKMTTETKKGNISNSAKEMMQIVTSVTSVK